METDLSTNVLLVLPTITIRESVFGLTWLTLVINSKWPKDSYVLIPPKLTNQDTIQDMHTQQTVESSTFVSKELQDLTDVPSEMSSMSSPYSAMILRT